MFAAATRGGRPGHRAPARGRLGAPGARRMTIIREWGSPGYHIVSDMFRRNHLSNTTCLTQAFFKRGEQCSKLW